MEQKWIAVEIWRRISQMKTNPKTHYARYAENPCFSCTAVCGITTGGCAWRKLKTSGYVPVKSNSKQQRRFRNKMRFGGKKIYGLGRLKTGHMNKTETEYSEYLERLKMAGEIVWYKFEGVKFRLADNTFLSPDFMVMLPNGEIQIREVKGFMMDDANVKNKICADMYPFRFFVVRKRPKKDGGGWEESEV